MCWYLTLITEALWVISGAWERARLPFQANRSTSALASLVMTAGSLGSVTNRSGFVCYGGPFGKNPAESKCKITVQYRDLLSMRRYTGMLKPEWLEMLFNLTAELLCIKLHVCKVTALIHSRVFPGLKCLHHCAFTFFL